MIMTIFDSLSEYWTSFVEAPLGFQLVLGAGAVTAFGAAKTGWKMLFPLRWVTAKGLRGTAWLLHHTENAANKASNRLSGVQQFTDKMEGAIMPEKNFFDTSSKKAYLQTLKHFNNKRNAKTLPQEQLDLLLELGEKEVYKTDYRKEKHVHAERADRIRQAEANKVLARIEKARESKVLEAEQREEDVIRKKIAKEQATSKRSIQEQYEAIYTSTKPAHDTGYYSKY